MESEAKEAGFSMAQFKKVVQNRVPWRGVVAALCFPRSEQELSQSKSSYNVLTFS